MLLLGQGREVEARRVGTFSIYLGLNVSAPFALLMGLFMRSVLNMLVADEQTFAYAWQYAICIIVAGGVTTVLFNALSNLLRNTGRSTATGFGIILGAGVATCISNCIACCCFFLVLRSIRGSIITFNPREGLASRESTADVFAVGEPLAITSFLFVFDYVILDKLMVSYHNTALAAVVIVLQKERFPLNIGVDICQGMMPLLGYNYAAGNRKRLHAMMRLSLGLWLVI